MSQFPSFLPLERLSAPLSPDDLCRLVLLAGFDAESYWRSHKDLLQNLGGPDDALRHFLVHGILEGRQIDLVEGLSPGANVGLFKLANAPMRNESYRDALVEYLTTSTMDRTGLDLTERPTAAFEIATSVEGLGALPFVVLGDSHSEIYCRRVRTSHGWLLPLRRICWAGSARGLNNPNSRSGYGTILRSVLSEIADVPPWPVLMKFGQVDIEFVFTFRRIRDGAHEYNSDAYEKFCSDTAREYLDFLDSAIAPQLRDRVFVLSVFPPSLADAAWAEGYTNAHITSLESDYETQELAHALKRVEVPGIMERTRIHRYFNRLVKEGTGRIGLNFVDDCEAILSPHGIVRPTYVGEKAGTDHHLDRDAMKHPVESVLSLVCEIGRRRKKAR